MATTLMPVNPAATQRQVARILPIRANLLPSEITATRNARRSRAFVVAAVIAVAVAMGGWYALATRAESSATDDLNSVTADITTANATMHGSKLSTVTTVTSQSDALKETLKTLMANDLPWSTLLTKLQATGTAKGATITSVAVSVSTTSATSTASSTGLPSTSKYTTIGTLTMSGTAADKATVADFVTALGSVTGVANPFVTSVSTAAGAGATFTITADITSARLCGRYTTPCGGK